MGRNLCKHSTHSTITNQVSFHIEKEEILPVGWYALEGNILLGIYDKLKSNEFFFYKRIEGKSYKARLKKNVKAIK